jgi:hypothetical protein
MRTVPQSLMALAFALAVGAQSAPLVAHHGWGGYQDKEFEITGVVSTPLNTAGAHATMKITVDGQVWNLTLAPPSRTKSAGLTEDAIPAGATITVHGHRHSNQKVFEVKTERITYNGRTFNVYPDRT